MSIWTVSTNDVKKNDSIFRYSDADNRIVIRHEYSDLQCPKCRKIDELKALERGITFDLRFPDRDLFSSLDFQYVIGNRLRALLEAHAPDDISYYPIPNRPDLTVAMPHHRINVDFSVQDFQVLPKCSKCTRYTEAIWGPTVPRFPSIKNIAVLHLESRHEMLPVWLIDDSLAKALKNVNPKLNSILLRELKQPS
jgi:hypothetical protein